MANPCLEAALHYAARGWPVFAVSRGKIPFKGTHGHRDATTDPAAIEAMWARHPGANVALATGSIVVFDCDGSEGVEAFRKLGVSPPTLVARTPRGGYHFYYRSEVPIRSRNAPRAVKGAGGLDIKGRGGFVLLPPSRGASGAYEWANAAGVADLPEHFLAYVQGLGGFNGSSGAASVRLEVPAFLAGRPTRLLSESGLAGLGLEWSAHEDARIAAALKSIGSDCGYDAFFRICCALHELNWVRSDGTDRGFELLVEWCERFSNTFNLDGLEKKWKSLRTGYSGRRTTVGTLFALAGEYGWDGTVASDHANVIGNKSGANGGSGAAAANGVAMAAPLPPGLSVIFPDTDKAGRAKATCANAAVAIIGLGITCQHDVFHDRMIVGGHSIEQYAGDLSDSAILVLRKLVWRHFSFDPGERHARDAALQLCLEHQFNPVVDYLAGLKWDGIKRLERWAINYLGAEDTELHRAYGALMLIAAVRRARAPGCKFDQIIVLEGPQGAGKSTAIRILASDDNFSDQHILGASDREQQEAFRGVWLHEIAELAGMRRTDVERIKQFARRTEDRARPAYGRMRIDIKRHAILIATTNEDEYLKAYDRAFWPIACGAIDLTGLARDRDQLWAEAAAREVRGDSIELPARLRTAAAEQQSERHEQDPWTNKVINAVKGQKEIAISDILEGSLFLMKASEINQSCQNRISRILKRLNFKRVRVSEGDKRPWKYRLSGNTGPDVGH